VRGNDKIVVDGPYTESKEIKADNLQQAFEISKGCPTFNLMEMSK
jgi:hypothetical protein